MNCDESISIVYILNSVCVNTVNQVQVTALFNKEWAVNWCVRICHGH